MAPYDDASWAPYGVALDVSQREDALNLSNIDCRESIGDILKYIQELTLDDKIKKIDQLSLNQEILCDINI